MLNPIIQQIAGVLGVAAGGTMVIGGIIVLVMSSKAGKDAAMGAAMIAAPEVGAAEGAAGAGAGAAATRTTISQSGRTTAAGEPLRTMRFTTRQGSQTRTVSVPQVLRNESWEYYKGPPPKQGPSWLTGRPIGQ